MLHQQVSGLVRPKWCEDMTEICRRGRLTESILTAARRIYLATPIGTCPSIDVHVGVSLFLAARQCGVSRTFKEMSELSGVTKKHLGKYSKVVARVTKSSKGTGGCTEIINRFASQLEAPPSVVREAHRQAKLMRHDMAAFARSPLSQVGAVLYLAGAGSIEEISRVLNVAVTSIRNCIAGSGPAGSGPAGSGPAGSGPGKQLEHA